MTEPFKILLMLKRNVRSEMIVKIPHICSSVTKRVCVVDPYTSGARRKMQEWLKLVHLLMFY